MKLNMSIFCQGLELVPFLPDAEPYTFLDRQFKTAIFCRLPHFLLVAASVAKSMRFCGVEFSYMSSVEMPIGRFCFTHTLYSFVALLLIVVIHLCSSIDLDLRFNLCQKLSTSNFRPLIQASFFYRCQHHFHVYLESLLMNEK